MTILNGTLVKLTGKPERVADSRYAAAAMPVDLIARLHSGSGARDLCYVIAHPSSSFIPHFIVDLLAGTGAACLALNTRYNGNDTNLLMEYAIQDIGSAVTFLREQGYRRIVLVGYSGGGSLMSFYQAEAEGRTVTDLPGGVPLDDTAPMPPADAIVLLAAHPSRAKVLTGWLDPSVTDEMDPGATDPALDMFDAGRQAPFDRDWLDQYRAAHVARNDRITAHALDQLAALSADPSGLATDALMIVHRTSADPRFVDVTIDADDRGPRPVQGVAVSNRTHNSMGRISSLRAWLSQWSLSETRADGPSCIARTSVPVLIYRFSADGVVFPSQVREWAEAAGDRAESRVLEGAQHFLFGQEALQRALVAEIDIWCRARLTS